MPRKHKHVFHEWTEWMPVDQATMHYEEEGRNLPVPPWMAVRVKSHAGEYPDIETARFFAWEPEYGPYSLQFFKVRLH